MLTKKLDLAADLAVCEAAVPGPWEVVPVSAHFDDTGRVVVTLEITLPVKSISFPEVKAIAQFIARSRESWPEVLRFTQRTHSGGGGLRSFMRS